MPRPKKYQTMTYEQLEEALLEKVHAYRTLQVAQEASEYQNASQQVNYILSFMNQGGAGSLEQLAREQLRQEVEFREQFSRTSNFSFFLQKKYTQAILDAVDEKLAEMGLPVLKPESYT